MDAKRGVFLPRGQRLVIEDDYEKIRVTLTVENSQGQTTNEIIPLSMDATHLEVFDGRLLFKTDELKRIRRAEPAQ
jgi:hypothetical protein